MFRTTATPHVEAVNRVPGRQQFGGQAAHVTGIAGALQPVNDHQPGYRSPFRHLLVHRDFNIGRGSVNAASNRKADLRHGPLPEVGGNRAQVRVPEEGMEGGGAQTGILSQMEKRTLGKTGMEVTVPGFDSAALLINRALDAGLNVIDHGGTLPKFRRKIGKRWLRPLARPCHTRLG